MAVHDFNAQRLFVATPLSTGAAVPCSSDQANYLLNVLRLRDGDEILVFNGVDGEWRARVAGAGRKGCRLGVGERVREQQAGPDIDYLFAPLKRARLDYMVQKATEMGVARLRPVLTRRTQAERVNLDRMRANAVEAAEQCGILHVPEVAEPERLEAVLARWDAHRPLVFCDEAAAIGPPLQALDKLPRGPVAVLVGPEGGFDPVERQRLLALPFAVPIRLGPRIMRADTAAVAALTLVNAMVGDWG